MKYYFLLGLLFSGVVQAGSSNGGSDSCGLGWEVAKNKSLLSTSIRATTGAIAPPTFSMTFGTSGCDKHSVAANELEAVQFASTNLEPLKLEISQGGGEYTDSFAQTLRCDLQGHSKLGSVLQSHYAEVSDDSGIEFFKSVKKQIRNSPELMTHCLS